MSSRSGAGSLPLFKHDDAPGGPDLTREHALLASGCTRVAGVDEAGRGPLAGPVVAAAVVLDLTAIPKGLDDSKKLNATKRQHCFDAILARSDVAWASADAGEIDRTDIRQASLAAMVRALNSLAVSADGVLIDGRDVPAPLADPANGPSAHAVIGGDARSLSIAAASIVAKCVRDAMMRRAAHDHPAYGFERHFGYPTKMHREALARLGPCPLHRKSFGPVRRLCQNGG